MSLALDVSRKMSLAGANHIKNLHHSLLYVWEPEAVRSHHATECHPPRSRKPPGCSRVAGQRFESTIRNFSLQRHWSNRLRVLGGLPEKGGTIRRGLRFFRTLRIELIQ